MAYIFFEVDLLSTDGRDKEEQRGCYLNLTHVASVQHMSLKKDWRSVGAFVIDITLCGPLGNSLSQNGQLRWLSAFYFRMSKLRW